MRPSTRMLQFFFKKHKNTSTTNLRELNLYNSKFNEWKWIGGNYNHLNNTYDESYEGPAYLYNDFIIHVEESLYTLQKSNIINHWWINTK